MTVLMFVYGTLKTGLPNHYLIENKTEGLCLYRGAATTVLKFPLVIASKYNIPFMLYAEGKGSNIHGELYEVGETRLQSLDALEAHPHLYERRGITVTMNVISPVTPKCTEIQAQAYFLVKYRPFMLNLPMHSLYDNCIKGNIYKFPYSRVDEDHKNDPRHWWYEVHTDYKDTAETVLDK